MPLAAQPKTDKVSDVKRESRNRSQHARRTVARALVGEVACAEQLVLGVLGHIHSVVGKLGTFGRNRVGVREEHLCRGHVYLVPNRPLAHGIDLVGIDNLLEQETNR